jgi:putative addiction module killer protein
MIGDDNTKGKHSSADTHPDASQSGIVETSHIDKSGQIDNLNSQKLVVLQTAEFRLWLRKLRDHSARNRILARIVRVEVGNLGDHKFFDGIGELRILLGAGYRIYFVRRGQTVVILLCGGDKDSQDRDIKRAIKMSKET